MPCEVSKDSGGTLWRVPAFAPGDVKKFTPFPEIDIWWNRNPKKRSDESLVMRQELDGVVGLMTLSLGQVYDLIDALNKAVEGI